MRKIILITVLLLSAFLTKVNAQEKGNYKNILDWTYWEPASPNYERSFEKNPEFKEENILTIKSIKNKINGFGTIMKTIKPDLYLGKTVKMSGYLKCENIKSWAGLWMRVDYYDVAVLAFDNMRKNPIKGTKDWAKYEIVLHVPADATSVSYGVLLDETGQVWFKDIVLELVDETTPETGFTKGRDHKSIPFETQAKAIANQIKTITDTQKNALKTEIDALDKEVAKGIISKEKVEELKLKKAEERAANIETKVAIEEGKLNQLIQDKVDGKFDEENGNNSGSTSFIIGSSTDSIGKNKREINITSMKVYNGQRDKEDRQSKRTTSQVVFATGLNNVVTNKSVEKSDFRYLGSDFSEIGVSYNSRIAKNNNLLHAKYGLSLMYNNLRPTDNRSFVINGKETNLVINSIDITDSRFRNVYLVAPIHLEFDFSAKKMKDNIPFFRTHQSVRFGIGGYAGINLKSKQIIKYDDNDLKATERTKGDFNASNFIYGLSSYIGYRSTSLYLKYDLNPLFKENLVKQNNVSLGLRFDFN
ncbi:coiled-coil domain-containing protein [Flavobacterium sp. DSR2-3-3]|uniref:coiled-coil domain-containing protein n=1 Tax=Flavobacterium sp. DSR2-3-3 TaxID=2804632 RepID=UPI003CE9AF8F